MTPLASLSSHFHCPAEPSAPESRESMSSSSAHSPIQRGPLLNLPRSVRRTLVALQALVALALLLYWHNHSGVLEGETLMGAIRFSAIGSVVFFGSFLLLYLSIDRLESRWENPFHPRLELDERQLDLRGRSYHLAYLLFGLVFFAYVIFPPAESLHVLWQFAAAASLYGALPTSVIAWLEPNPPKEPLNLENQGSHS
jgi:hypothetical protein